MLVNLLDMPVSLLTLNALSHNKLNTMMLDEIAAVMQREKWTCHICNTRLKNMMEIDHLKGHAVSGKNAIAPICQICHAQKHLLWAASRGRITIVHAPELNYSEISQLSWALILHDGQPGFNIDRRRLVRDLSARHEDALDAIGHDNIEAFFEMILHMAKKQDKKTVRARLVELDRHLRIVPVLLTDENADIQIWSEGGFKAPSPEWKTNALQGQPVNYDALKRAGSALADRIEGF